MEVEVIRMLKTSKVVEVEQIRMSAECATDSQAIWRVKAVNRIKGQDGG